MNKNFLIPIIIVVLIFVFFMMIGSDPNEPLDSSLSRNSQDGPSLNDVSKTNNQLPQNPSQTNSNQEQKDNSNTQDQAKKTDTINNMNTQTKKSYSNPPEMMINEDTQYTAVLKTTEGDITFLLNTGITPITANNFIFLAKEGFYDNTIFHRVVSGFMIQGGDPTGTGAGGPGYRFDDEDVVGNYARGTVAMANSGPDTNGSQFFIMHGDKPLDPNYVIFGYVTAGLDVVDKIATAPVTRQPTGEQSKPVNPVKILNVEIVEVN